ncbi:MAG: DUF5367 family protein [Caulobacter sp.]|nr:DUF5367 family protein [Caulobacter sp.]
MSKQDGLVFGLAGLVVWAVSTAYYVAFGPQLLESAFWFYAANAFLAAVGVTLIFHGAVRLRRLARRQRPLALALYIAPGLLLGALTALKLTDLLPDLDPVSIGRYGAFMIVGYATVAVTAFERRAKRAASHVR